MKRNIALYTIFLSSILLTACPDKNEDVFTTFNKKGCPVERIDWMKVTRTYDKTKVIDLSAKISAAASADASQIKQIASGDAKAAFGDSLSRTITESVKDSVQVSQEFFEQYQKQRQALCQLIYLTKDPAFRKDTHFLTRLQDQYFEITKAFTKVKEDEEKKNQP